MYTIGVFAIILNKTGQILLSHRRDMDLWNLPGGGMHENESPQSALLREIKEETGLAAKIIRLTAMNPKPQKNELVLTFQCLLIKGEPKLTDEADKHNWFGQKDLPLNTVPKQFERIIKFFHSPDEIFMDIQDQPSTQKLLSEGDLEEFNKRFLE